MTKDGKRSPAQAEVMELAAATCTSGTLEAAPGKKPFPTLRSDEEAEAFVATADLSEYDFSGFRPGVFIFRSLGDVEGPPKPPQAQNNTTES